MKRLHYTQVREMQLMQINKINTASIDNFPAKV